MLSKHDQLIADGLTRLFREWQAMSDKAGPDEFTDRACELLATADDPEAVWQEHIKWGTAISGRTPDDLPKNLRSLRD